MVDHSHKRNNNITTGMVNHVLGLGPISFKRLLTIEVLGIVGRIIHTAY